MWFIKKHNYTATYGAAALLGVGGSTLLVTALTMLADLIGENVVSCLSQIMSLNLEKLSLEDRTSCILGLTALTDAVSKIALKLQLDFLLFKAPQCRVYPLA